MYICVFICSTDTDKLLLCARGSCLWVGVVLVVPDTVSLCRDPLALGRAVADRVSL